MTAEDRRPSKRVAVIPKCFLRRGKIKYFVAANICDGGHMLFDVTPFCPLSHYMCESRLPIDDHSWLYDVGIIVAEARLTEKIRL